MFIVVTLLFFKQRLCKDQAARNFYMHGPEDPIIITVDHQYSRQPQ